MLTQRESNKPSIWLFLLSFIISIFLLSGYSRGHNIKDNPDALRSDSVLHTGWYYIVDSNSSYKRQLGNDRKYYFIDPNPITSARDIITITIYDRKEGGPVLLMKLDDKGAIAWSNATNKWIGKRLGFILDDRLLEVDYVNSQIEGGTTALIQGYFTKAELENFKTRIKSEE